MAAPSSSEEGLLLQECIQLRQPQQLSNLRLYALQLDRALLLVEASIRVNQQSQAGAVGEIHARNIQYQVEQTAIDEVLNLGVQNLERRAGAQPAGQCDYSLAVGQLFDRTAG